MLDDADLELKTDLDFLKKCARECFDFFSCKVGMEYCSDLSLAEIAALFWPHRVQAAVDVTLHDNDVFLAARAVGCERRGWSSAMFLQKQDPAKGQRYHSIMKRILTIDGSLLERFPALRSQREYVKCAVGPGPFDDILHCNDRHSNLKMAAIDVYKKDSGLEEFVRSLLRLGCSKKDFPATIWDSFWSDMSLERQCECAALVILDPSTRGVSRIGSKLWFDLPHGVTKLFKDCTTYQCGICMCIPEKVFNCVEGCMFHCCQDCRGELSRICPMCRANQTGPCGRRCRAAEEQ